MINFKYRSHKKEWLDAENIPFKDIERNMKELDIINSLLGGHKITIGGILELQPFIKSKEVSIVEIGCGGGDNLRAIKNWAAKNNVIVQLTGVDINPDCIAYAKNNSRNANINFICSDYRNVKFNFKPEIIFSSLFCHHFSNDELVQMLQWKYENAAAGFFINDLHRHPLAYYPIKILTRFFSKSYLVKNDAPLSVQRSFIKKDWTALFKKAAINNYKVQWWWAFRWLVTCSKQ